METATVANSKKPAESRHRMTTPQVSSKDRVAFIAVALLLLTLAATFSPAQDAFESNISPDFPFESRYIDVLGSKLHYIDEGAGDPIVFLHGNPTSSYLWRNVIPHLSGQGRTIALDLIGMGKSDKPNIDYTYADHVKYVEAFIEKLNLKNITFVVHDWGSALGLDYSSRHEDNVVGVAFMEALVPPAMPQNIVPPNGTIFHNLRHPEIGEKMIYEDNFFVERVLPTGVRRDLTEAEMANYRAPFLEPASRKPTLIWPRELPFADGPQHTIDVVTAYGTWMAKSDMPFLLLYVSPGVLISIADAEEMVKRYKTLESHYLGLGSHFVQEDHPHKIGRAIADWRRRVIVDASDSRD
jgi:haloalkane dehalogenase